MNDVLDGGIVVRGERQDEAQSPQRGQQKYRYPGKIDDRGAKTKEKALSREVQGCRAAVGWDLNQAEGNVIWKYGRADIGIGYIIAPRPYVEVSEAETQPLTGQS